MASSALSLGTGLPAQEELETGEKKDPYNKLSREPSDPARSERQTGKTQGLPCVK